MRFILRFLLLFLLLRLLVANVFPQGPSLVIALGRFFRVPLSDDESGVFFGLFSVCIVNVLNFHLFFTYRFIYQKKLFVIVIVPPFAKVSPHEPCKNRPFAKFNPCEMYKSTIQKFHTSKNHFTKRK